jgi:hypothetical protein
VAVVQLARIEFRRTGPLGLRGRYVSVHNAGAVNVPGGRAGEVLASSIGQAQPDANGDFLFEQGHGGGRMDKVLLADPDFLWRYLQAAHFGEVNVYFHLDRIAAYVHALLRRLKVLPLPRVVALVNAHHAATEVDGTGLRDGISRGPAWLPFQGAHYRLPGRAVRVAELVPVSVNGEIHFGPGRGLTEHGALAAAAGGRYRANASHNPGIIYHEYGHHIIRHTADLNGNALRAPDEQDNRKSALDEGTSDYFAAMMLDTPHIWAFHHRHDRERVHPRSLSSKKTMADYDAEPGADPHANGTIWGAALWDLRLRLAEAHARGAWETDLLVLRALSTLGSVGGDLRSYSGKKGRARRSFAAGLAALVDADETISGGQRRTLILDTFARRGIILEGRRNRSAFAQESSKSIVPA